MREQQCAENVGTTQRSLKPKLTLKSLKGKIFERLAIEHDASQTNTRLAQGKYFLDLLLPARIKANFRRSPAPAPANQPEAISVVNNKLMRMIDE